MPRVLEDFEYLLPRPATTERIGGIRKRIFVKGTRQQRFCSNRQDGSDQRRPEKTGSPIYRRRKQSDQNANQWKVDNRCLQGSLVGFHRPAHGAWYRDSS